MATVGWKPGRHRVAVLVRDGLLPMELGIVHQVLGQARSTTDRWLYDVRTCALTPGPLRTVADIQVDVPHGLEALDRAETVVVPASTDDYTDPPPPLPAPLARAFARITPRARIASICTGAFVLAAAGLLDGRRATTHWSSAERLGAAYPSIAVDPDVLYVDEGAVLTSAGEAAGIDLCLHVVRRDHGAAVAADVARRVVVPPHREGGQAQYVPRPVPEPRVSSTSRARSWALAHLDRPVTLKELAEQEATSVRTLSRRFREEVGQTPLQWLTQARIERARELLEETDLPIERVAGAAGFGTPTSLRQHLQAALGVSPSAYRATFRGSHSG